jgi:hypothetical protein
MSPSCSRCVRATCKIHMHTFGCHANTNIPPRPEFRYMLSGLAEHTSSLQYLFVKVTCLELCTLIAGIEHGYTVSLTVSNMPVRPHTPTSQTQSWFPGFARAEQQTVTLLMVQDVSSLNLCRVSLGHCGWDNSAVLCLLIILIIHSVIMRVKLMSSCSHSCVSP